MSIGGWKRAQCIWRNVFGENAFFEYILRTCWTPCRLTNVFITFRECSFFKEGEKHWRKVTILDARCTGARRAQKTFNENAQWKHTQKAHTHTRTLTNPHKELPSPKSVQSGRKLLNKKARHIGCLDSKWSVTIRKSGQQLGKYLCVDDRRMVV